MGPSEVGLSILNCQTNAFGPIRGGRGGSTLGWSSPRPPPPRGGGGGSDVLEGPHTVGGRGVPPPPALLPFQCLRLTAKSLLWRLRCQEDLSFKSSRPAFGGDHRGTLGGVGGVPAKPPPPALPLQTPPIAPFQYIPWEWGVRYESGRSRCSAHTGGQGRAGGAAGGGV